MPTNRNKRQRQSNKLIVPKALIYYFETGDQDQSAFDECDRYNEFTPDFDAGLGADAIDFWRICREEVVAGWIRKHPGTRPYYWWVVEAPKEPRQRIGGIGTPHHEVLGYSPSYWKGIPTSWVSKFEVDYYNGRAKDIHGNPIETTFVQGGFGGKAIDPANPPRFESEAAYLLRRSLLTAMEKRHLEKHPELLEPDLL
jgi:hypothetical protein